MVKENKILDSFLAILRHFWRLMRMFSSWTWNLGTNLQIGLILVIIQVVLLDFGPEYLNLKYSRSLYSTEPVNRLTGHFAIKKPVLGS